MPVMRYIQATDLTGMRGLRSSSTFGPNPIFINWDGRQSVLGIDRAWYKDLQLGQLFAPVKRVVYLIGESDCPSVLKHSSEKEPPVFEFWSVGWGGYEIHPDNPALRENEYGLRTVEPTVYHYNDWCCPVTLWPEGGPSTTIAFLKWLDAVSQEATTSRFPEIIGHEV
ncbi:hypothetical protein RRF57_006300 [Xylaria bambusicola]|uniref:Uncharacterized protein n=1 Tax=Xylaria bambusicola TaxID=326684 RepID=A0AAN7UE24_9PEZI